MKRNKNLLLIIILLLSLILFSGCSLIQSEEKTENNNEPNKFDLAKAAIHKAILNTKSISEKEREEES